MINSPTCFKNPEKPSCTDLILTNYHRSFQNSCAIEAELSDFHKLVVKKLNAISRITQCMDFTKSRLTVNSPMTQSNYCSLIWMCHNRTYKKKQTDCMKDLFD